MPPELPPPDLPPLSALERYHILRDQIQHEDSLTTQRLSWLLASQAFLFTGYAIVLNGPEHAPTAFVANQRAWLLGSIPFLGFTSAALILVSIVAGVRALHHIHRLAAAVCQTAAGHRDYPPIQGTVYTRLTGLASPLLIPPIFAGVWFYLMLCGMRQ
jgi:hypothetical protein